MGFLALFASLFTVRTFGDRGEVSQVFHLSKSVAVGGGNYAGFYNVAITPKGKIAQTCGLFALTPEPYVDLLDRQAWLWPPDAPLYAYAENSRSRVLMWLGLAAALLLPLLAALLWQED